MELTDFKTPGLSCAQMSRTPWPPRAPGSNPASPARFPALPPRFPASLPRSTVGSKVGSNLAPPLYRLPTSAPTLGPALTSRRWPTLASVGGHLRARLPSPSPTSAPGLPSLQSSVTPKISSVASKVSSVASTVDSNVCSNVGPRLPMSAPTLDPALTSRRWPTLG